ncbi:MAG: PIN domain-containing protein [Acetobacteraceae bacterium]|nr:PIN domain-containing protein [Acetobacteraceae bacterium]
MTVLHMLDTDMCSYIIKRRSPSLAEKLSALPPASICISVVTRAELQYGLKRLPTLHRLHDLVRRFLRIVRALAWDEEAADRYAEVRHRLAASGRLIGEMDMMIAAHALAANAVLVTNNIRHFERVGPHLGLVNWAE